MSIPAPTPTPTPSPTLLDWTNRRIDYLRISVTDRCNERCTYCMPADLPDWQEKDEILTYEEILRIVRVTVALGFRKYRLTGGEPLVRRDLAWLIEQIGMTEGVESLGLSTNGTLLAPLASRLRAAGVDSVNISLDTLDPDTYARFTRGRWHDCVAGIDAAVAAGFPRVKLNAVLMRGMNDHEIPALVRFAHERGALIRFIELMPITTTQVLTPESFLSAMEAKALLERETTLERLDTKLGHGPAVYYRTAEGATVGFIGAMTDLHFCESCNKVRLTADGKLRPCLGNHLEFDLKGALREARVSESTVAEGDSRLFEIFRQALGIKPREHDFRGQYTPGRHMTAIGG